MTKTFDALVVGAGPAGYHAAIRLAQHGLKTACIDKAVGDDGKPTLGGVCLNWGCIPSKALLDISHKYKEATSEYDQLGIMLGASPSLDIKKMMTFKQKVVGQLTGGIKGLLKGAGVEVLHGTAQLSDSNQVTCKLQKGSTQTIQAKHIVLAPGSLPMALPNLPQSDLITDSTGALAFDRLPKKLGIIGAGVIGLELGSVWSRLGSEVVLLEALDSFLPAADKQIATMAQALFKKQGLSIQLGAFVSQAKPRKKTVQVTYTNAKGEHQETFDKLVVAVGRRPDTESLLADNCGIQADEKGFIQVNDYCQTAIPSVYAIGDAVRGPMLAHKGMEEGLMVADRIAGGHSAVNYQAIPSVIYTSPEIAWVGHTEETAKAEKLDYTTGSFPFAANGRALAGHQAEGKVKVIVETSSDRILGVHILGPQASELIAQAVIGLEFGASAEDLSLTMFAHPTLSEAVHEAALHARGEAIHIANRKKASN